MKKLIVLFIALTTALSAWSYTWNSIGPDTINANRICFGMGLPYWVICEADGMYLYNYSTHECDFYTYGGLPVWDAAYLSVDKMLIVMGDGSWSDGIWTFDFNTHQFEVVEWYPWPTFLLYDDYNDTYWAGFQFGGMKKSTDGLVWEQVPYFENKSMYCMDYYGDHMVASEVSNIYGIYYSVDGGDNWAQSNGVPMITDMKFDGWGKLCGIFPDLLDSSGLWESDDFGETWEIVFYSENMSSIGFDAFGETFVGWKGDIGIARYDPNAPPPGLIFLNQGLPNLNINRIQINPTMSAPALFVSTEGGVFYSYDYMVGVGEPEEVEISIYPNPAHDQLWVKGEWVVRKIEVLTLAGQKVHEYLVKEKEFGMDISTLDHGIYIVNVETEKGVVSKKVVIR